VQESGFSQFLGVLWSTLEGLWPGLSHKDGERKGAQTLNLLGSLQIGIKDLCKGNVSVCTCVCMYACVYQRSCIIAELYKDRVN
jgi:hypothetical protein